MIFLLAVSGVALVKKRIFAHARESDFFQIARRDDPVGVDVVAAHRYGGAGNFYNFDNLAHSSSISSNRSSRITAALRSISLLHPPPQRGGGLIDLNDLNDEP